VTVVAEELNFTRRIDFTSRGRCWPARSGHSTNSCEMNAVVSVGIAMAYKLIDAAQAR
jgi:hypothetical protein